MRTHFWTQPSHDKPGAWEACAGIPGTFYVVRVRHTRIRARMALMRLWASGTGYVAVGDQ
jgi:hypothetical protein